MSPAEKKVFELVQELAVESIAKAREQGHQDDPGKSVEEQAAEIVKTGLPIVILDPKWGKLIGI